LVHYFYPLFILVLVVFRKRLFRPFQKVVIWVRAKDVPTAQTIDFINFYLVD